MSEIKDPDVQSMIDSLNSTHGSYVSRMNDGHNSIFVRSEREELTVCYSLMREAARLIEKQERELDEDAGAMRVLRRHRDEAERAVSRLEREAEVMDERMLEESRLREENWREAHVQERIKEYRDRCYTAESELAELHKELYER
jgi:exonuclease VII large subunit